MNQRTKLMYSEKRGFYYEADLKGVADAEENLRKAKLDKTVSELQKKITSLQDSMKKETDEIDNQIKALNEYSEAWGEVSSKLQNAIEDQRAAQILGQDWENQILNQRLDTLQNFTNQYIALQQAQKDAYLAARQAEAEASQGSPSGNNGSGGSGSPSGGSPSIATTGHATNTSANVGAQAGSSALLSGARTGANAKTQKYSFAGKTYSSLTEAQAAQRAYIQDEGDKAYNKAMQASIPDQNAKKKNAEQARKKAEEAARKKQIKALYKGTDSAKSGDTLVGERGSEIVLNNNGTATVVDSPTIMKMKGGEKVFNAEETEKILKTKYRPLQDVNPKKFMMLHAFASGTSSPMQTAIEAQAVGIANGLRTGVFATGGRTGQTINQTFNVSLPNITDSSKASDLFKEFEQLQRKATQFFN